LTGAGKKRTCTVRSNPFLFLSPFHIGSRVLKLQRPAVENIGPGGRLTQCRGSCVQFSIAKGQQIEVESKYLALSLELDPKDAACGRRSGIAVGLKKIRLLLILASLGVVRIDHRRCNCVGPCLSLSEPTLLAIESPRLVSAPKTERRSERGIVNHTPWAILTFSNPPTNWSTRSIDSVFFPLSSSSQSPTILGVEEETNDVKYQEDVAQ